MIDPTEITPETITHSTGDHERNDDDFLNDLTRLRKIKSHKLKL